MGERQVPTEVASWLGGDIDAALGEIRVPAWILDRDGFVRWANARAIELFGDLRGKHFTSVALEAQATVRAEFAKKMLGSALTSDYETVFINPAGGRMPVEVHSIALTDGGRAVGVFGIADVDLARPVSAQRSVGGLTPRQLEVLQHLARGRSTHQIAQLLGLSRETVRNHIRAILRSLRVHSRLEAVAEARRRGIVS